MLDDLKLIHERDAQDALGIAEKQWQQYQQNFGFSWSPPREIFNVVVAGMGGSGLAAKVFSSWPGLTVPFEIVQNYELPETITDNTLVICSSYSGNTEETLSVFERAIDEDFPEKPMVVVVASGGKLLEHAEAHKLPFVALPTGFQPRMTLGYQLRALVEILEQTPLLDRAIDQLRPASDWLKGHITTWIPTVPTAQNQAKQIAQELTGKSIVVYSGPKLFPVAYKWKISFNENAKHIAWVNQLPEFNHNEMLGWTKQPVDKPYAVIDLRSKLEHPRVQKRFEVTEKLLSGLRPSPIVIEAQGETLLEQLVWTTTLGDFVSLYLAILNGLNPTPVELIERFKKELG
jgi:glucose/mannose-6-phosphate isomerase